MATIRKRSWQSGGEAKTAWIADYFDQQGVRRQKTFARRKDADAWLITANHQVKEGVHMPESTSKTLGEAIDLWLQRAEAEGLERATLAQYAQHRGHILAAIPADTKLAKLTTARVEQLRDDLLMRHSRSMARKLLQSLKSVLKDAKRRGLVAQNVAVETSIGEGKRHQRKLEVGVDVPTPAEVKALLDAAEPKARAMVCLAALAGLRASELRGLRWSDLALGAKPAVTIAQRADRWSAIGSPKSESSQRTVPLGETAARALKVWRLAQPAGRSLVFGTAADKPDVLGNLQRRLLSPLEARAGIRHYGWHAFRHYAISAWLAAAIDPKRVQKWAGHATLTLTLDTYGHMIPRADDHARIADAELALA